MTERGPAVTPEYVTTLSITPSDHSAEPPTPEYTVRMVDHAFAFPAGIEAGRHLFRVENLGHKEHMMFIAKMPPGKTLQDVLAEVRGEAGEPSVEEAMIDVHVVAPGVFNDVTFDLAPGEYAAVCFVSDPESGTLHAMLGMTQTFTVAAASGR